LFPNIKTIPKNIKEAMDLQILQDKLTAQRNEITKAKNKETIQNKRLLLRVKNDFKFLKFIGVEIDDEASQS
jgi:hypothetical protein